MMLSSAAQPFQPTQAYTNQSRERNYLEQASRAVAAGSSRNAGKGISAQLNTQNSLTSHTKAAAARQAYEHERHGSSHAKRESNTSFTQGTPIQASSSKEASKRPASSSHVKQVSN